MNADEFNGIMERIGCPVRVPFWAPVGVEMGQLAQWAEAKLRKPRRQSAEPQQAGERAD